MCVDGVPSTQWHLTFRRRLSCRYWNVLQNEATGVRDGIVEEEAAGEVLLIDAMSSIVRSMKPEGRGCAERVRRSR
jgi:hypothetical protein